MTAAPEAGAHGDDDTAHRGDGGGASNGAVDAGQSTPAGRRRSRSVHTADGCDVAGGGGGGDNVSGGGVSGGGGGITSPPLSCRRGILRSMSWTASPAAAAAAAPPLLPLGGSAHDPATAAAAARAAGSRQCIGAESLHGSHGDDGAAGGAVAAATTAAEAAGQAGSGQLGWRLPWDARGRGETRSGSWGGAPAASCGGGGGGSAFPGPFASRLFAGMYGEGMFDGSCGAGGDADAEGEGEGGVDDERDMLWVWEPEPRWHSHVQRPSSVIRGLGECRAPEFNDEVRFAIDSATQRLRLPPSCLGPQSASTYHLAQAVRRGALEAFRTEVARELQRLPVTVHMEVEELEPPQQPPRPRRRTSTRPPPPPPQLQEQGPQQQQQPLNEQEQQPRQQQRQQQRRSAEPAGASAAAAASASGGERDPWVRVHFVPRHATAPLAARYALHNILGVCDPGLAPAVCTVEELRSLLQL